MKQRLAIVLDQSLQHSLNHRPNHRLKKTGLIFATMKKHKPTL